MLIGFVPIAVGLLVYIPAWLYGHSRIYALEPSYLGLQIRIRKLRHSHCHGDHLGRNLHRRAADGVWRRDWLAGTPTVAVTEARIFAPYPWCGLIWGAWHFPLIPLGFYSDVGVPRVFVTDGVLHGVDRRRSVPVCLPASLGVPACFQSRLRTHGGMLLPQGALKSWVCGMRLPACLLGRVEC